MNNNKSYFAYDIFKISEKVKNMTSEERKREIIRLEEEDRNKRGEEEIK